jgi:multidrug resistance efflux pump
MSRSGPAIAFGLLFVAAIGGGVWYWFSFLPAGRAATTQHLPGVVEVQEVRLGSKVGGRVRDVLVSEGSLVEAGTSLVTFEVPELLAQRSQWDAKIRSAEANLEKARNGPRPQEIAAAEAAVAAADARAKRMKVGFREEEIREARDDWTSAEADLKLAEDQRGRYERLFEKNTVAQAELDTARANHDRARGKAAAARAHLDMLTRGNRPEDIAEADATRDQAKANLDLLKAGTRAEEIAELAAKVSENRSRLQEIEVNLEEATVRAPARSVIDVVPVRKGDLVAAGQTVVRILRAEDLWVRVYIPELELGKIRLNQPVQVTIDAYPGRTFAGKLVQIATVSEFTPRNIQSVDERRHQVFGAKVVIDDPQGVFKSGMAAEVAIANGGAR